MKRIANQLKSWKSQVLILMILLFSQVTFAQHSTNSYGDSIIINNNLAGWAYEENEDTTAWKSSENSEITFSSFSTNSNKESYFLSPEIKVEKGKVYTLCFSYKGKNIGSKLHTFLTTTNDGSTAKAKLEEYTIDVADSLYTKEVTLAITSNSTYYLGFACEDNIINDGVTISNVKIIEYNNTNEVETLQNENPEPQAETVVTPITNIKDNTKPKTPHANQQTTKKSEQHVKEEKTEKTAKEKKIVEPVEEKKTEETIADSIECTVDTINTEVAEKTAAPEIITVEPTSEKKTDSISYTLLYIILGIVALAMSITTFLLKNKNSNNNEIIADQQLFINKLANEARIKKEQQKVVVNAPKPEPEIVIPDNFNFTDYTKELITINTFHKKVLTHLQELIDDTANLQQRKSLVALKNKILTYNDTLLAKDLIHNFTIMHPVFIEKLSKSFPQLSKADLALCTYLYLGLSTKEIASLTDREVRSIESARNRLRKKINLEAGEDFNAYFTEIENS